MSGAAWPTDPTHLTVRFPFGDEVLEGTVREEIPAGDVRGPEPILRVYVAGAIYRTTRTEAEPIPDRY
ncbi:hypothetical protein Hbl1158_10095 [Halobaculum sp. CBA1158]|uniref:hypothetical protein n=1 Tax=Halobaculum sp. CBA1158 TaxID=2904243 RepID=UPI001F300671|nr:hypothetical protein [Halobaculum sp. CBA1158]UIO98884.1 hypothetical protein Hbl1158_10095 [Halobaculum sp. CBA1158]